ncbi:unnamed protein product [Timema podura]|uniref:tRNA dimethylallyltransferase n=1 Tax=Timema podura TaxID=61482 RepID=A0ABN7P800_TIMPD|nr:unnamed protein product [Timema podura]
MSRIPLIIILGATGSGKSKLAIEIAKKYGGEIVNADAMQLYKELNIITNKVSSEEQNQAPHHLLDISDPLKHVNVVDYRNMAIPILDDLLERRVLPLVVGGTNYYIESILWKVLVEDRNLKRPLSIDDIEVGAEKKWKSAEEFAERTGPELHSQLEKVDPDRAKTLHPNDRRKIIRQVYKYYANMSLQVFAEHGRTHSSMLKEQKETSGGNELGGPLRYPHSCILWLQCDQEVLDHRLVSRVDTMLEQGLVQELINFHQLYNKDRLSTGTPHDYTTGIFQSIGFKEFHDFLMLDEEERESPEGKRLFQRGLEEMKLATRRYARKQLKWIRNRFLRRPNRPVPNVYGLDGTDPSQWDEKWAWNEVKLSFLATIEELPRYSPNL